MMPFFTGPLPVQCVAGRRPGILADATQDCSTSEDFSPRTVLTKNFCRCVHHILKHFPTTVPNSLRNNLFVDGFNSSSGWLLVIRTRGAWWCRYRGHCRSGPRHLSPRSRVCAQEWHSKDIHSHIHSHTPMHTPKKKRAKTTTAKCSTHQTWCLCWLVLFLRFGGQIFRCWWPIFSLAPAPRRTPCRLGHF